MKKRKDLRWMSLDNAAKIFPAAMRRNWSNVFRLSATLTEEVDRDALKSALDVVVNRFPSIAVRIKRGFFWYILEEVPEAPKILDEKPYPLSRMLFDDIRKCAFRVLVYKKRIAVEFFHALTDGNGGLVFLKTLVAEYLRQKYGENIPSVGGILDCTEEPSEDELEDSFLKNAGGFAATRKDTNAYRIKGKREVDGFKTNTTFIFDADKIVGKAKEKGITVTAYMTAAMMLATLRLQEKRIKKRSKRLPVKVLLPVNLRKMFGSNTLRNFILYATPGVDPRLGEYTFDELCNIVHHQMQLMITKKNMAAMMTTNVNDEKPLLLRMTPLFIKNIVMKAISMRLARKRAASAFPTSEFVPLPRSFHATYAELILL